MTEFELWLKQATRHLSKDSAAQVRSEIVEHYESARETALSRGATPDEADRQAVTDLGAAKAANRQYRKVLLTSAEARLLRQTKWETRAVCSRPWLKRLVLSMPAVALLGAAVFYFAGSIAIAKGLLADGLAMALIFAAPFLPIYTPSRSRIYRIVRCIAIFGAFGFVFGKSSWLLFSCLYPLAYIEWVRYSIRSKLPVSEWPKQLYL